MQEDDDTIQDCILTTQTCEEDRIISRCLLSRWCSFLLHFTCLEGNCEAICCNCWYNAWCDYKGSSEGWIILSPHNFVSLHSWMNVKTSTWYRPLLVKWCSKTLHSWHKWYFFWGWCGRSWGSSLEQGERHSLPHYTQQDRRLMNWRRETLFIAMLSMHVSYIISDEEEICVDQHYFAYIDAEGLGI